MVAEWEVDAAHYARVGRYVAELSVGRQTERRLYGTSGGGGFSKAVLRETVLGVESSAGVLPKAMMFNWRESGQRIAIMYGGMMALMGVSGTRSVRTRISRWFVTRMSRYDGTIQDDRRREYTVGGAMGDDGQHRWEVNGILTGLFPGRTNSHQLFDLVRVTEGDVDETRRPHLLCSPSVRGVCGLAAEDEVVRRNISARTLAMRSGAKTARQT